jgi:hypothetical protein
MAERPKAESFTAFLEARERQKARVSAPAPGSMAAQGATPLSLLFTLADSPRPEMKLSDLQASSGMSFTAFADNLTSLRDSGYVAVTGPPGSEVVVLTALGQDVSRLARPAATHP